MATGGIHGENLSGKIDNFQSTIHQKAQESLSSLEGTLTTSVTAHEKIVSKDENFGEKSVKGGQVLSKIAENQGGSGFVASVWSNSPRVEGMAAALIKQFAQE